MGHCFGVIQQPFLNSAPESLLNRAALKVTAFGDMAILVLSLGFPKWVELLTGNTTTAARHKLTRFLFALQFWAFVCLVSSSPWLKPTAPISSCCLILHSWTSLALLQSTPPPVRLILPSSIPRLELSTIRDSMIIPVVI